MKFNNKEYNIAVWNGEKLSSLISFDAETEMITHESIIPELITLQIYDGSDTVYFIEPDRIAEFFDLHQNTKFIAHNAKFDMSVLQAFIGSKGLYQLYDECRVIDTAILFRLLHLATVGHLNTRYGLDYCVKRMLNIDLPKDEEIRTTFAQFKGKSPLEIPKAHLEYAAKDAVSTLKLYLQLVPEIKAVDKMNTMLSHDIQVKGDWALGCIMRNGIGFDLARKEEWLAEQDDKLMELQRRLANYGWVRGQKGVNQRFEDILHWLGIKDKLPLTATGSISSTKKDLEPFRAKYAFIADYLDFNELEKACQFVRDLDSNRVHSRYNLLLNTGRTSCSKPNIQNVPRIGGLREMYVPKQGHVLIDIDYSAIELAGLAQVNLRENGYSVMGDLINEGKCLHYHTASSVYGKPESEITKDERQFSKIPNFGFGANMSPKTFVEYCQNFGVEIDESRAHEVKEKWKQTYPEMIEFFKVPRGEDTVYTLTGRARADCTYTAYLNTKFQGLCADGLKLAMYELCKEGFTIVAEIHDQVVIEYPKDGTEESAMKYAEEIMIKAMKQVIPDIRVSTEGQILERWCK
jgi:DNA polymerase-1